MKIINVDPLDRSIWLGDVGNEKNSGTNGRATNQARYIPAAAADLATAVQLIETGEVLVSAASGEIAQQVSNGILSIVSIGELLERTLGPKTLAAADNLVIYTDVVFGRPIKLKSLILTPEPTAGGAADVSFVMSKDIGSGYVAQDSPSDYKYLIADSGTKTIDISAVTFGASGDANFAAAHLFKLAISGSKSTLTSITASVVYQLLAQYP